MFTVFLLLLVKILALSWFSDGCVAELDVVGRNVRECSNAFQLLLQFRMCFMLLLLKKISNW